jgi:hypothetical protein
MNRILRRWFIPLILFFLITVFQFSTFAQVAITFKFANPTYTNTLGVEYFEFDITAEATANSQFKIAQIYINYSTEGFGDRLVELGNIIITAGELLNDVYVGNFGEGGFGDYSATIVDNNPTILAIQNFYSRSIFGTTYLGRGYELTNTLDISPKVYVHVKMKIMNSDTTSGLSFNTQISQWDIQDFYFTTPFTDIQVNYAPVIASSTLDAPLTDPLPVELVSFNASINDKNVLLDWETATELNNYGFEIERKQGSIQSSSGKYEMIGFVNGNGNSNSPKEYSFIDHNVQTGNYCYRLKQIDTDGQFEYSPEVFVKVDVPQDYNLAQNFPNPFNPSTTINFTIPEDGLVKLSVYNLLGQEIRTLVEEQRQAGTDSEIFEAGEFNSGVYFYELRINDFVQTKKMQFLK